MPVIRFIEHSGTEHRVEVAAGQTLMQAACFNQIPGILGDCGGCCSCATCHCYLEAGTGIAPPSEDERLMLEGALEVHEDSRLACQVVVTNELDGLVVRLPESQV